MSRQAGSGDSYSLPVHLKGPGFEDSGHTIQVRGQMRPVLKYEGRLFVGETLSLSNPYGYGGRVWSANHLDTLRYNANFTEGA